MGLNLIERVYRIVKRPSRREKVSLAQVTHVVFSHHVSPMQIGRVDRDPDMLNKEQRELMAEVGRSFTRTPAQSRSVI